MEDVTRHRPENEEAGSLAELLRRELAARVGPEELEVSTPGSPCWAHVVGGNRSAQVSRAGTLYHASFWESHVHLAAQTSRGFARLMAGLDAWLVERVPASVVARRNPDVQLDEGALAYEAGPAAYVADRWAALRAQTAQAAAAGRAWDVALLPAVDAAAAHPLLGRLLPYVSLTRLGVSPGLAPVDRTLPLIDPLPSPGRFALCTYDGDRLAEGTASEVVALLAEHASAAGELW